MHYTSFPTQKTVYFKENLKEKSCLGHHSVRKYVKNSYAVWKKKILFARVNDVGDSYSVLPESKKSKFYEEALFNLKGLVYLKI